jgi:8-amino-7-oxononanoate synthase
MPDFTSALYLGLTHDHGALRPWRQLTTGRPAALGSLREVEDLESALAEFLGCGAVAIGPSTFHLFWDLFDMFADDITIHRDSGAYPIAHWAADAVGARGVPQFAFASHDRSALRASLALRSANRRPLVLVDGLNPLTGQPAPLPDYLDLVRQRKGWLVLDDTQAIGILGRQASAARPLGIGGAGTPAWFELADPHLIRVASLAKGFGVPLALIGGSRSLIERFKAISKTRVHCSPPSQADIAAARRALMINARHGETLRQRLINVISSFRQGLSSLGLAAHGGFFPVQTLVLSARMKATGLHTALDWLGVATVLHRARRGGRALVSFILNASHGLADIEVGLVALHLLLTACTRQKPVLQIQE